jgi:hypothetical protein
MPELGVAQNHVAEDQHHHDGEADRDRDLQHATIEIDQARHLCRPARQFVLL